MGRSKQTPASERAAAPTMTQKLYATVGAMIAARLVSKVVQRAWVKVTGKVPPESPESPDVRWAEAVGWSVLSGTSVAVARLLAKRRAAGAWQRVSTSDSHGGDPNDAQPKAQ